MESAWLPALITGFCRRLMPRRRNGRSELHARGGAIDSSPRTDITQPSPSLKVLARGPRSPRPGASPCPGLDWVTGVGCPDADGLDEEERTSQDPVPSELHLPAAAEATLPR